MPWEQKFTHMRIGITTFTWAHNYGAVLQAYALQTLLRELGHDPEFIDFQMSDPVHGARKWLSTTPQGCVQKWDIAIGQSLFSSFKKLSLNCTSMVFRTGKDLNVITDRYDLLITGSDQVWNPRWLEQCSGLDRLFLLDFACKYTRRISYAASFGHSTLDTLGERWVDLFGEKLAVLDAISVREDSGVPLVKNLCGREDAVLVPDPTLLLPRNHYDELIGNKKRKGGYLFSFILHGAAVKQGDCSGIISEKLELKRVTCDARTSCFHRGYVLPSPSGWLKLIRDAEFVVTNSFHATVFCLIFHTPFAVELLDGVKGSMNSRIMSLLAAVGLSERGVAASSDVDDVQYGSDIDWSIVDASIQKMRDRGTAFLLSQTCPDYVLC